MPAVFPTFQDAATRLSGSGWMRPSGLIMLDEIGTAEWQRAFAPAASVIFGIIRRWDIEQTKEGYEAIVLLQVWSRWTAKCPAFAVLDAGAWRLASLDVPEYGATYVRIDASSVYGLDSFAPYPALLSKPGDFENFKRDLKKGTFIRP